MVDRKTYWLKDQHRGAATIFNIIFKNDSQINILRDDLSENTVLRIISLAWIFHEVFSGHCIQSV